MAVVLLNAAVAFVQEYRAERAIEVLTRLLPQRARVIGNGREQELAADAVVRGDLLVLEEGAHVPADARVIEEAGLAADHAVLTGESVLQRRIATAVRPSSGGVDTEPNYVFMGTSITSGSGLAVVFATGMRTRFGAIAALTMTGWGGSWRERRSAPAMR